MITAIADQKAAKSRGFLNKAIYQIGRLNKTYPLSFHEITVGNNSVTEFDSNDNPGQYRGFLGRHGVGCHDGAGLAHQQSIVDYHIHYVSPGDGQSAISTIKLKPHPKPIVPRHVDPH